MNPPVPDPPAIRPSGTPWARLRAHILHPELDTSQVAWSFAIGLAMAWNPLLGTHTGLLLAACLVFRRLHRPLMFLACFVNNPWTTIPMATVSAYFGNLLLGRGFDLNLAGVRWGDVTWRSFTSREGLFAMHAMLKPVLGPYILGGFAIAFLSLPFGYLGMRWLTNRLRRIHWKELHLPHPHMPHLPHSHTDGPHPPPGPPREH